jgi:hypothetical protein
MHKCNYNEMSLLLALDTFTKQDYNKILLFVSEQRVL